MMGFWDEPQSAAKFKHAVLERYAPLYARKTGKFVPGNAVALIDAYAGKGWYDDATPASPAHMLDVAERLTNRAVECWFVESDAPTFEVLQRNVAASEARDAAHVSGGRSSRSTGTEA